MTDRHTWTRPELQRCADRWTNGETWGHIAASYGLTRSAVHQLIRRHGVTVKPRRTRIPKRYDMGQIRLAVGIRNAERLRWSDVAERVGWAHHPAVLSLMCRRYGLEVGIEVFAGPVRRVRP